MATGEQIKLTSFSHGAGWACKLGPEDLAQVLSKLPIVNDPNVLVGTKTADDAAVYRLTDDLAVVATVDFFTPVVDDAYDFGLITGANSISDIYAMGAKPLFALNIVGFPSGTLPLELLAQILKGGGDKLAEAGISVIGGHTIDDPEPKFGMAVIGIVHPAKIIANVGAKEEDRLFLTKPLGIGIITTGIKRGLVNEDSIARAVKTMATLNKGAGEAMVDIGVNAATDVTGFGLLGHLYEMTRGSKVGAEIYFSEIPVLAEAWELAAQGVIPGGAHRNLSYLKDAITWNESLTPAERLVLCDPQTSGGMLMAVPADKTEAMRSVLAAKGVEVVAEIGRITGSDAKGRIKVLP